MKVHHKFSHTETKVNDSTSWPRCMANTIKQNDFAVIFDVQKEVHESISRDIQNQKIYGQFGLEIVPSHSLKYLRTVDEV